MKRYCSHNVNPGLWVVYLLLLTACSMAPYRHEPFDSATMAERAVTHTRGPVEVSAFTPGAEEAERLFGIPIYKRGIQPVWLKISNGSDITLHLSHYGVDPDYFSPLEVAYIHRKRFSKDGWKDMQAYLHQRSLPRKIRAGETVEGFIFTNLSQGTKAFNVDLLYAQGKPDNERLTFFLQVPGFKPDHADVQFDRLYPRESITEVDLNGLRQFLVGFDCCSKDRAGTGEGNPINIVLVAKGATLLQALLRAGWSETTYEKDENYLASADYLFGRPPDGIFRKKRDKSTERSELNVWLSPLRFEDRGVWMAQFKHAIGRRYQIEELFLGTRMDPDVDDGRNYLMQDLWYAQSLQWLARSRTAKPVSRENPATNFRNNPYFTDGYRFVLWLSDEPIALDQARLIAWDEYVAGGD
jgi:hypothetical protein